jgi:hypothetical protein
MSQIPQTLIYQLFPVYLLTVLCQILLSQAPASALSSADECLKQPKCREIVFPELVKTVTAVAAARTRITIGAENPLSDAAAPVVIVDGQSQAATPVYYWNISLKEQAQALARSKYCGFYPKDSLCLVPLAGGQRSGIPYSVTVLETTNNRNEPWYPRQIATYTSAFHQNIGGGLGPITGPITGIHQVIKPWHQYHQASEFGVIAAGSQAVFRLWSETYYAGTPNYTHAVLSVQPLDGQADVSNPEFVQWQNWSKAKREAAVNLISPTEWGALIESMPVAGKLNPGETITAPKIVLPGAETDDPNTPLIDERVPRVVTPSYTVPTSPPIPQPSPTPTSPPPPAPSPTPTPPPPTPSPTPTPPPPAPSPTPPPPPSPSPNPSPSPTPTPSPSPDDIWSKLTPKQVEKLKKHIEDSKKFQGTDEEHRMTDDLVRTKGKLDENGCLRIEIPRLGGYKHHNDYATYVTGSQNDLFIMEPGIGEYAYYDGQVKRNGAAYTLATQYPNDGFGIQKLGAVVEVKTKHFWLRKFIAPENPNRHPDLQYDSRPKSQREEDRKERIVRQLNIYSYVANSCQIRFFASFNQRQPWLAARELFELRTRITDRQVKVSHIFYPEEETEP